MEISEYNKHSPLQNATFFMNKHNSAMWHTYEKYMNSENQIPRDFN